MPERAAQLDKLLQQSLDEMKASPPYLNPKSPAKLRNSEKVCRPLKNGRDRHKVWMTFEDQGAKVVKAQLLHTDNGGHRYEEWYRTEAKLTNGKVTAKLPRGTTHYLFNLIDENHFLVSYPEMKFENDRSEPYSKKAFKTE
jgi:hypothetical protein